MPPSDPELGLSIRFAGPPRSAPTPATLRRSWPDSPAPAYALPPLRMIHGACEYAPAELQRLAHILSGADHFRRMRLNPVAIELAVTMPLVPSHLEKELATTLGRPGGFLTTSAAFSRLAETASRRR